jgi:DNA-binding GntR family transcriptional regulator
MSTERWVSTSARYVDPAAAPARAWEQEAKSRGGHGSSRIVEVGRRTATGEVAEALELAATGEVADALEPTAARESAEALEPAAAREAADAPKPAATREAAEALEPTAARGAAETLELAAAREVVVRRRVMYLDDRPVELTDSYVPASIADGTALAEPGKIRGGAVALLARLGYRAADVTEEVTCRPPTAEEAAALELPQDEWVLVLTRTSRTAEGTPFEVDIMTMPARHQRLRYDLRRG